MAGALTLVVPVSISICSDVDTFFHERKFLNPYTAPLIMFGHVQLVCVESGYLLCRLTTTLLLLECFRHFPSSGTANDFTAQAENLRIRPPPYRGITRSQQRSIGRYGDKYRATGFSETDTSRSSALHGGSTQDVDEPDGEVLHLQSHHKI